MLRLRRWPKLIQYAVNKQHEWLDKKKKQTEGEGGQGEREQEEQMEFFKGNIDEA